MDMTHINAFLEAMQRKDQEAMLIHMADDVVLKTPLAVEPFKGKAAIKPVVEALLGVVDKFDFRERLQGSEHVAQYFGVTVGSNELDGIDYWRINEAGLIQEMTVLWRPLPTMLEVQKRLDSAHGETTSN